MSTHRTSTVHGTPALLVLAILLAALNLRPAITSVGPLLDRVQETFAASAAWAGLLTTVPVLCFAAAGLAAPTLARWTGIRAALAIALGLLAAGLVLRVLGGSLLMVGATVVAAAGIAVLGVLIPVVVKGSFPARVGLMTGLYTAALQTGAMLGAALAPPLESAFSGWRPALGVWALPAVAALVVWLAVGSGRAPSAEGQVAAAAPPSRSLLRSPLAWTVTAFFGLQAFVAFAVLGWLPQILIESGVDRGTTGLLFGLLSIIALPVSLLVPPLAAGRSGPGGWIVGLGVCGFAGAVGMLAAPTAAPVVWVVLLGLGMSVFSLALTVIALRARTDTDTARLSGMAQGIGYLIASTGPFVFGALRDATGSWTAPFGVLLVVIVLWTVTGAVAGRPGHV